MVQISATKCTHMVVLWRAFVKFAKLKIIEMCLFMDTSVHQYLFILKKMNAWCSFYGHLRGHLGAEFCNSP